MDKEISISKLGTILNNNIQYLNSLFVIDDIKKEVLDQICAVEIALEEKLNNATEDEKAEINKLLQIIANIKAKHIKINNSSKKIK